MVFNRKRNAKVKWEKQIASFRKQKKDLARAPTTAVSDHSDTRGTSMGESMTNGSETDPIGGFGDNGNYEGDVDAFTLGGNNAPDDFEPISDMRDDYPEPPVHTFSSARGPSTPNGYGMNNFAPDTFEEDTYENMNSNLFSGKSQESGFSGAGWGGQGSYHLDGRGGNQVNTHFFRGKSNDSAFNDSGFQDSGVAGQAWAGQGSYHLDGIDNTTATQSSVGYNRRTRSSSGSPRRGRMETMTGPTEDTVSTEEEDGEASTYYDEDEDSYAKYARKYDLQIPEKRERVSNIMLMYDTILSNPILTMMTAPCIPCLAFYVKANENRAPQEPQRRRSQRGMTRSNSRLRIDDDTFAEYNAQRQRFDDISRGGTRMSRRPNSRGGTEFSYINSYQGGGSRSRVSSRGQGSEFSHIASTRFGPGSGPGSFTPTNQDHYGGNMNMRPDSRQSSGVMGYSQGYDSATDGAGSFMHNVPQGQWQGDLSGTHDASGRRVGFNMDGDLPADFSIASEGYGSEAGNSNVWTRVGDSVSRSHRAGPNSLGTGSYGWGGQNPMMGPGGYPTEDATYGSSIHGFMPGR